MTSLRIYSTRYRRGAVVKLTQSDAHAPVAKFVIERERGQVLIKQPTTDLKGRRIVRVSYFQGTESQAIEHCERECERILHDLGGSDAGQ